MGRPIPPSKAADGLESTVTTDRVCIDLGQGACADMKSTKHEPIRVREWWKLFLAGMLAADAAIFITAATMFFGKDDAASKKLLDEKSSNAWSLIPQDSRPDSERGALNDDDSMAQLLQGSLVPKCEPGAEPT